MKFLQFALIATVLTFASCSSPKKSSQHPGPGHGEAAVFLRETYHGSHPKEFNLVHTRLQLAPVWQDMTLLGIAEVTLTPNGRPRRNLVLDARSMLINEVFRVNGENYTELAYGYRNDSLLVDLGRTYDITDTLTVLVDYVARPEHGLEDGSRAITSEKGLFFINADGSDPIKPVQLWTQGETRNNSVWFPTIDWPNQKMTQEIYLTVDTGMVTLSNGILISSIVNASEGTRTDYWRQSLPHAPYLTMIAAGKFSVMREMWNDIELSYYVEDEFISVADKIFIHTPEMLDFFSEITGIPFPWGKYAQIVVRDFVSGAMENTTAVVYGEFVQQDQREMIDRSYEDFVAHEMAHHWFGDLVTCESWSNIPLNEAFATYGEYLWYEYWYGKDEADYTSYQDMQLYLGEAAGKQVNLIRFSYEKDSDMYDRHSYQKGARVLHMLRSYTGDELFFKSIRKYLLKSKFGTAEIHDLRLAFEEVTGEDMNWFFDQWFLSSGHPVLEITNEYSESEGVVVLKVRQLQDLNTTPLYRLPVDVDLYFDHEVIRRRIVVDRSYQEFKLPAVNKPSLLNFDAEKSLVCEKTEEKTMAEWTYQYRNAPLFADRLEALQGLQTCVEENDGCFDLFIEAMHDPSPHIRSSVIDNSTVMFAANRVKFMSELTMMLQTEMNADVKYSIIEALLFDVHPRHDDSLVTMISEYAKDSSYNVQSIALEYLLEHETEKWMGSVDELSNSENRNERSTAVHLYSRYGGDAQFEYMNNHIKSSSGRGLYNDLESFGSFLLKCNSDKALEGVNTIGSAGVGNDSWSARLGAYRALLTVSNYYREESVSGTGQEEQRNQVLSQKVRKRAAEYLDQLRSREENEYLKRTFSD